MIVGIHQNVEDIINKLKHIQQDIDKNYSEWNIVREKLLEEIRLMETKKENLLKENNQHIDISNKKEVELENLLEEIRLMETKKEILLKQNNQHIDISNKKEVELEKKRLELDEWEQRCIKREEDLRREIEEERKVSILKNIQSQLKEKVNENELLMKQLNFYKRNIEKYSIIHDNISLEIIDDNSMKGVKSNTKKDTKEEKRLEESEASKRNQKAEEEGTVVEEEGTVVEDFEYKGILYYIDNLSGDIYARLENDEVGDLIGHKDNRGRVKFQKKK